MTAPDTSHLINFATIKNPRESLTGSTMGKDKYIRLRTADGTKGRAARFFAAGVSTFSNLNIRHAQTHEITVLLFEPFVNRGIASLGAVYEQEILAFQVYYGQGITFKTYKAKGTRTKFVFAIAILKSLRFIDIRH